MSPVLPQGLTAEQFARLSTRVRQATTHLGSDIQVHGSRAAWIAKTDSDLDIAIRVTTERFQELLHKCFGTPNPNSAKERTLLHARQTGKIQAGEAGLRVLRKELESDLGIDVDLSVISLGGPFDKGPYIPLAGA